MRGLTKPAAATEILDRRLLRESARPLAVAFSGGGDSLALLLIADAWAREAGRDLLVLTVDHRLQPRSADWTERCRTVAERLGRPFRALAWEGPKPARGLPAAARAARHRLLATAAREAGARVVLMGHTASDVGEARVMRDQGSTTPEPREWGPSPVWPDGRGVFLLRPLLGMDRGSIRDCLQARGETWIEDPANADPAFARSRARQAGAAPAAPAEPPPLALAGLATETAGVVTLRRSDLRDADAAERFLSIAAVCAGGGERLPTRNRSRRVAEALRGSETFVATLAGARIEAGEDVLIFREAGEAARGGLAPVRPQAGTPFVWDGRFELVVETEGAEVRPLAGLATRLPRDQQAAVHTLPPAARRGLPAVVSAGGAVACPALGRGSLVGERLRAASGLVEGEDP